MGALSLGEPLGTLYTFDVSMNNTKQHTDFFKSPKLAIERDSPEKQEQEEVVEERKGGGRGTIRTRTS